MPDYNSPRGGKKPKKKPKKKLPRPIRHVFGHAEAIVPEEETRDLAKIMKRRYPKLSDKQAAEMRRRLAESRKRVEGKWEMIRE